MQHFFFGWRLIAGCVALALACIIMVGWIKSIWFQDEIEFYFGRQSLITFYSVDQSVTWAAYRGRGVHDYLSIPVWRTGPRTAIFGDADVKWSCRWGIFASGQVRFNETSDHLVFWSFPYCSALLPLALFSACVVFWKPRKKANRDA